MFIAAIGGFIAYQGFYARVYNQSNVAQNAEIGVNVRELTLERVVTDLADVPDRYTGTRGNAEAGQYIRNYCKAVGLLPYTDGKGDAGYYHSFQGTWLKNSVYYGISVDGTVESVAGKLTGADSSQAVVLSAHFDSFMNRGGLDNATGVGVLLELSKRLAERFPSGTYTRWTSSLCPLMRIMRRSAASGAAGPSMRLSPNGMRHFITSIWTWWGPWTSRLRSII